MKQNNKKFNNAMHKFVGVLDKYEERLRAIFSQYGPELVRVNKKFIIWLCLTPNYLKSESWWIGMNETVYQKAFKTQQFSLTQKNYIAQEKVKLSKKLSLSI